MNDPFIGAVVFPIVLSFIIVCIGVSFETRRRRKLNLYGRTVTATVTDVRLNTGEGYGEMHVSTAEWRDPRTGATFSFQDKGSYRVGASVEVVFDPENPRNCYFRRVTTEDCFR